jgi:DNA-directed RNA polymerase specialized sigma24 family protein
MADLDVHHPAIAAGDADAFGRWVTAAEPELRVSLRSFAAVADCEAVLQEALLRVWQAAPRVEPDGRPNALLRFAVRVSRNLALSEARRFRTAALDEGAFERVLDDVATREPPEHPDPLLRRAIEGCRDELPEKPAAALAQRMSAGGAEPDELLAERLGMRLNTFLQNFTRARKLLAACLEGRGVALAMEWR